MSAETIIALWKDTRSGLISEVEKIPEDQFSFRATPETRSIAELLQHIVEAQKVLAGETCRPDTNIMRQKFPAHIAEYAADVKNVTDKNGLLELLSTSMDECVERINSWGDKLEDSMTRMDGQSTPKSVFLTFSVGHEMYHRGQLTVYERLLNIEPVLTGRIKKFFAQSGGAD